MSEQTTAEQVPADPQIAKIHEYPSAASGRLLLGRRLFLAWNYVDPEESPTVPGLVIEPRSLEIWAIDSEVMYDRALALLAMVSVEDGKETVPPAMLGPSELSVVDHVRLQGLVPSVTSRIRSL